MCEKGLRWTDNVLSGDPEPHGVHQSASGRIQHQHHARADDYQSDHPVRRIQSRLRAGN